jgi:hypothetical protein
VALLEPALAGPRLNVEQLRAVTFSRTRPLYMAIAASATTTTMTRTAMSIMADIIS